MFAVRIVLRPTGALTFRRVPFSTIEMLSYPFVPPTALSGYLDRLLRLVCGEMLPEEGDEQDAGKHFKQSPFYALPQHYHVLGALAQPFASIRATTRQGIRDFDHASFSRLQRDKDKNYYQLYQWEYLLTDHLIGYVLHEENDALEALVPLVNYGSKLGKEGWAYIERVDGPFPLEIRRAKARPASLVPATDAFGGASQMYPLYRYAWRQHETHKHALADGPAPIDGYLPFLAALVRDPIEMDYYHGEGDVWIPVSLCQYF